MFEDKVFSMPDLYFPKEKQIELLNIIKNIEFTESNVERFPWYHQVLYRNPRTNLPNHYDPGVSRWDPNMTWEWQGLPGEDIVYEAVEPLLRKNIFTHLTQIRLITPIPGRLGRPFGAPGRPLIPHYDFVSDQLNPNGMEYSWAMRIPCSESLNEADDPAFYMIDGLEEYKKYHIFQYGKPLEL